QRDVIGMPHPGGARHRGCGSKKSVDRSRALARSFGLRVILDLNLVAPAQVDAAVGSGAVVEFDLQAEIIVRSLALQVRPAARAAQLPIRDTPWMIRRAAGPPTREVPAIEEPD